MIKLIFVGTWVVIVLSASVFVSSGKHNELLGGGDGDGKPKVKVETLKMNPVSIALIREGRVKGYLVVEPAFTYTMESKKNDTPIGLFFQDALVNYLFNNDEIDTERLEKFDLVTFRQNLKKDVNKKLDGIAVEEVLIQRIDYLSIDEVRDNKLRAG